MSAVPSSLAPKMKPVPPKRTVLVAALDVGTSKVACLIGRLRPNPSRDVLRRRTHAIEVLGFAHTGARGMKAGAVVDLAAAEAAIRQAVDLAERGGRMQLESVVIGISAGRPASEQISASIDVGGEAVSDGDIGRVLSVGSRHSARAGRTVLHSLPIAYALDDTRNIRDPRGMFGRRFGIDMHVMSADIFAVRNLMLAVERCHLDVEALVAGPYAAGLSVLADDEADLGAAVVEMGAGSTTIATYSGGRFVHASGFAVGGHHITMDLARGLSACIADAERIKTLYGTVLTGGSDARELMSVPTAGDNDQDVPQIVSRATIANIVRHRAEEIFEMVRDRLKDSPFAAEPKGRVVLSGGASQLTGMPELATQILGRPVRIGRPLGFGRLPAEAKTASFAVPAGLLVYPQYAHLEHVEPRHTRHVRTGTDGYFGKVGRWLREGF